VRFAFVLGKRVGKAVGELEQEHHRQRQDAVLRIDGEQAREGGESRVQEQQSDEDGERGEEAGQQDQLHVPVLNLVPQAMGAQM
jgi:hypothetical protein